jgi:hypothetical protein
MQCLARIMSDLSPPAQQPSHTYHSLTPSQTAQTSQLNSKLKIALGSFVVVLLLIVAKRFWIIASVPPSPPDSHVSGNFPAAGKPLAKNTFNLDPSKLAPGSTTVQEAPKALLRIRARGAPLMEYKLKPAWNLLKIRPNWEQFVFNHVGPASPELCARSARASTVRSVWTPFGFGSNMFNLVHNILHAAFYNKTYVFVSMRDRDYGATAANEAADLDAPSVHFWSRHEALPASFEEHFGFAADGDTVCESFAESCGAHLKPCFGVAVRGEPSYVKRVHPVVLHALKTAVLRELLRLKPVMKLQVDSLCAAVGCDVRVDEDDDDLVVVAIHVRRGDKIVKQTQHTSPEARLVKAADYVHAAVKGIKGRHVAKVFVVSDDAHALREIVPYWKAHVSHSADATFVSRVAADRPDKTNEPDVELAALVDVLVDIRLLASADVFVGTGTSQFGALVYSLRAGAASYDAEHHNGGYVWRSH